MSDKERLEEIERLIEHRDEHMNNDCDYSNADQYVHLLSDEGHIDFLVKQNKRYRELLDRILELQLYINYSEAELYEEVLKIMDEYLGLESESK